MQFRDVNDIVKIFNCKTCSPNLKKWRGCIRPFKKKQVWRIDECVFCDGKNKKCKHCKGRGWIPVGQCPRSVATGFQLMPYYIAYRNSHGLAWPDGRGRFYQPVKLVSAFDILDFYFNKFEAKRIKNA